MTENIKKLKKKVFEGWKNAFPELSVYSQNKLYKVLDAVIIGIELIKLPRTEEYRPHFVIYPLWKKDVKACLDIPIILKEYYNEKGHQFDIPYIGHDFYFAEAISCVRQQTPISFSENISLGHLFSVFDVYSKTPPLRAAPNSYLQAVLQQEKTEIALYKLGSKKAQDYFDQIKKRDWDLTHFKMCGVDIDDWLNSLQEKINHPASFLNQIKINKQNKKVSQLKSSHAVRSVPQVLSECL